jgi:phosphate transport system substrate-binding protein
MIDLVPRPFSQWSGMNTLRRFDRGRRAVAACILLLLLAGVASTAASAATARRQDTLTGAGSTFVFPLISQWIPAYQQATGTTIAYSPVGSGAGIAQITARTVDFGASDAPLSPDQFAACKGCVQIPWALSATAVTYHLSAVKKGQLKLTGPVLADIFLGKITKWNDPRLRKLNPDLPLPDESITVAHRSDGSGTTYNFTDYLSSVSPEWKQKVGRNISVSWPVGEGGKGNPGVAAIVAKTEGAIGYNEISYALANKLNVAKLRNAVGRYTTPGLRAILAATKTVKKVPASNEMHIVNPPKSDPIAYPICAFTYVIVPLKSDKAAALHKFILWALTTGQESRYTAKLLFVPIPKVVVAAAKRTLDKLG